ncbi:hypothetical protein [Cyanobium sp. ATX 6F1]|uniref:hypothetical protein n=1 Tax=unclassified Cyanobium TaxID=2627006 RepID=UPI0020CE46EF|nr:hypothetical protein [Cyanobium sp. ATX 6F1]MCP9916947.1 hypothetical protein [Cyanobium sp. ATX 6F1]
MEHALVFVLAPQDSLPGDEVTWDDLLAAQLQGVGSGSALRMFRVPADVDHSLEALVGSGHANASGDDPFLPLVPAPEPGVSEQRRLICDALIPHLDTTALWLGAYELRGSAWTDPSPEQSPRIEIEEISCLDQVSLGEIAHETCWFYPTENGDYLCWENQRKLELKPGYPVEAHQGQQPIVYDRGDMRLLWSLMANDQELTCVGLTYQRRRIEWPIALAEPERSVTWTSFSVDDMGEESYRERSSFTVCPEGKP